MSLHFKSVLYLISAAVVWSTSGLILKSIPSVPWLVIAGVRSCFASLLFFSGFFKPRPPTSKLLLAMLIYAVLVTALMGSMQLGTAAQGIWLQYIAPAVVAIWSWFICRQRARATEVLAVIFTTIAVALIVTGGHGRAHAQSTLLGVISGVGFGFFVLLLKSMETSSPSSIYLWTNLGTVAIALPSALALGMSLPTSPRELLLLALMGIGQLGLGYYLFQRGLAGARALEASLIVLLEPILNPIWVYLFLREIPSPRVIAGCSLIAVALVVMSFPSARNQAKT